MINWLRKRFGLHLHTWSKWNAIRTSDGGIAGARRFCQTCKTIDEIWYPDGH